MKPADYPVAASKASPRSLAGLRAERRVGKYIANARTEECFDQFLELTRIEGIASLEAPTQLLTQAHLRNSIAGRIPRIEDPTRVLVEGFILELLARGDFVRIPTLSKDFDSYQAICSAGKADVVLSSISELYNRLCSTQTLSLKEAVRHLPKELTTRQQNIQILLGSLVYDGRATTDAAPGIGITTIRMPHAAPRL